jgi:putative transposase
MKRRFSNEQIISMIKEQENGIPTSEVCRKYGISSAIFYKYKSKYGGMDISAAKKLKAGQFTDHSGTYSTSADHCQASRTIS